MVSEYEYRAVMDQLEYNYDTKEWELLGRYLKGIEPDYVLKFSSRYSAHEYIYNSLKERVDKETAPLRGEYRTLPSTIGVIT